MNEVCSSLGVSKLLVCTGLYALSSSEDWAIDVTQVYILGYESWARHVVYSVLSVYLGYVERWGAGVETHFQEIS